ncbi:MAG: hypothetical protein LJE91_12705 [Gammaproteobacteria bacterium]|jgi:hypothetical protein|nr:hypothetical protein [Gammaproteobacteria bacterium]
MPTVEDLLQDATNRVASLSDSDIAALRRCGRAQALPLWKAVHVVLNIPPPDGIDLNNEDEFDDNSKRAFCLQHGFPKAGEDMLLVRQHLLDENTPEIGPYQIKGLYYQDVNARQTFTASEVKTWCTNYGHSPVAYGDATRDPITADMPFMNPTNPNYAPELAAAVDVWLKLFRGVEDRKTVNMTYHVHKLHPELGSRGTKRIVTILRQNERKK